MAFKNVINDTLTSQKEWKKIDVYLSGPLDNLEQRAQVIPLAYENPWSSLQGRTTHWVAIDGGLTYACGLSGPHSVINWFGDQDSLTDPDALYDSRIQKIRTRYLQKKDFSDFGGFLDDLFLRAKGPLFLEIFGGLGGRKDHEIIGLLECARKMETYPFPCICVFQNTVILSSCPFTVDLEKDQLFSLVAPTQETAGPISITGARHAGDVVLSRPSHGLSNVCTNQKKGVTLKFKDLVLWTYIVPSDPMALTVQSKIPLNF